MLIPSHQQDEFGVRDVMHIYGRISILEEKISNQGVKGNEWSSYQTRWDWLEMVNYLWHVWQDTLKIISKMENERRETNQSELCLRWPLRLKGESAVKTKVNFCAKVNRYSAGPTITRLGHIRRLKSKTYKMDKLLNVSQSIRIENKDYVIMRLAFSSNPHGLTQEIWVVPKWNSRNQKTIRLIAADVISP